MLLRASSQTLGEEVELEGVVKGAEAADVRVPGAKELLDFADAVVSGDASELSAARETLLQTVSPEEFVDAAGVIGNFERMVRIADGTGIPLDDFVQEVSKDMRDELGLNSLASAAHTLG